MRTRILSLSLFGLFLLCLLAYSNADGLSHPYTAVCRLGGCTGTLIGTSDTQDLVATNAHCIGRRTKTVNVTWPLQKIKRSATVLYINRDTDICLLSCST